MSYRKALMSATTMLAAAALLLLGAATSATAAGAGAAAVQGNSPLATPSKLVGAAAADTTVRFAVGLKLRNRAGAIQLAREVSEPSSADYRHFLTPRAWERRFSPRRERDTLVSNWLRAHGMTVEAVTPDRMTIYAQGSAAAVEHAFGVSLGEYRHGRQELRLASGPLTMPRGIAALVSGVSGVDQRVAVRDSLTGAQAPGESEAAEEEGTPAVNDGSAKADHSASTEEPLPAPPGFRNAPPCSNYYGEKLASSSPSFGDEFPHPLPWAPCGYVPAQLQGAYNLTGAIAAGIDGAGVTVAIVDAYASPTLLSDAEEYGRKNQPSAVLSPSQFTEIAASKYSEEELCEAPSWAEEQTLDVESVHALAPGAHILYVGAESCLDPALFGAVQKVVDGHLADVVTDSWGDNGGDLLDPASEREAFDNVLIMAGGTGVGVQFSAGDEGSNFTDLGFNAPDYPTISPWAISVGGTTLEVSKQDTRTLETGWSTAKSYLCSPLLQEVGLGGCTHTTYNQWDPAAPGAYDYGGGGGTSYEYEEPYYQLGVVPASLTARNAKLTHIANRVDPDISMDADPSTGEKIGETQAFSNGTYYGEYRLGGTSLASPLFAGLIADADQVVGGSLGFVNPLLYKIEAESGSPYLTKEAIYDVLAAGKQALERNDYLEPENATEETDVYTTTRVLGYEGSEEYCSGTEECETQSVELHATPGFDSMTGIGSPGPEFLRFMATIKPPSPE